MEWGYGGPSQFSDKAYIQIKVSSVPGSFQTQTFTFNIPTSVGGTGSDIAIASINSASGYPDASGAATFRWQAGLTVAEYSRRIAQAITNGVKGVEAAVEAFGNLITIRVLQGGTNGNAATAKYVDSTLNAPNLTMFLISSPTVAVAENVAQTFSGGTNKFTNLTPAVAPRDWSYGDASPKYVLSGTTLNFTTPWAPWGLTSTDTGYGSPYAPLAAAVLTEDDLTARELPDNGGHIIKLKVLDSYPPDTQFFKVTLVDKNGAEWPKGSPFCLSPYVGDGVNLRKVADNKVIEFVLPSLPIGTYDVVVKGKTGSTLGTVSNALKIIRRNRPHSTYEVRNSMSSAFKVGNRILNAEELLKGGSDNA